MCNLYICAKYILYIYETIICLNMSRQLICRGMCKIVTWAVHYVRNETNKRFFYNWKTSSCILCETVPWSNKDDKQYAYLAYLRSETRCDAIFRNIFCWLLSGMSMFQWRGLFELLKKRSFPNVSQTMGNPGLRELHWLWEIKQNENKRLTIWQMSASAQLPCWIASAIVSLLTQVVTQQYTLTRHELWQTVHSGGWRWGRVYNTVDIRCVSEAGIKGRDK